MIKVNDPVPRIRGYCNAEVGLHNEPIHRVCEVILRAGRVVQVNVKEEYRSQDGLLKAQQKLIDPGLEEPSDQELSIIRKFFSDPRY